MSTQVQLSKTCSNLCCSKYEQENKRIVRIKSYQFHHVHAAQKNQKKISHKGWESRTKAFCSTQAQVGTLLLYFSLICLGWSSKAGKYQNRWFIRPITIVIWYFKNSSAFIRNPESSNNELLLYSRIKVPGSSCTTDALHFPCTQELVTFRMI